MGRKRDKELEFRILKAKHLVGKKIRYTVPKGNKRFEKGTVLEGIVSCISYDPRKDILFYRIYDGDVQQHIRVNNKTIEIIETPLEKRLNKLSREELINIAKTFGLEMRSKKEIKDKLTEILES